MVRAPYRHVVAGQSAVTTFISSLSPSLSPGAPTATPRVRRSALGYRLAVPAVRQVGQTLQFLDEDDAARALHDAGRSSATGVYNVATEDWLTEAGIARVTGGRIVRLPLKTILALSEMAFPTRLLPFGSDRAVLLNGPLALDPRAAAGAFGWPPTRTSADVLAGFVDR